MVRSNLGKKLSNLPFFLTTLLESVSYSNLDASKRWKIIKKSSNPSVVLKRLCEGIKPGFVFDSEGFNNNPSVLLIGAYEPSDLPAGRFDTSPYGLQRIASFLCAAGIDASIFPVTSLGKDRLLNFLNKKKFDFIGFSVLGPTLPFDIQLTHDVKKIQKKAILIVGGAVPTAKPGLLINSAADYLIRGYGEGPLLNLIVERSRVGFGRISEIKGVYTRDKSDKFKGLPAKVPTYSDLKVYSYLLNPSIGNKYNYHNPDGLYNRFPQSRTKVYRIMGQGFCPKRCKFCSTRNFLKLATKKKMIPYISLSSNDRIKVITNILNKLKGVRTIFISDDDFFTNKKIAIDFFKKLILAKKNNIVNKKTSFILSARIDELDNEILRLAKKSGVILINIGVESFSKRSLDLLSKDVDNKSKPMSNFINESLVRVLNNKIIPSINLILFHPFIDWDQIYISARNALSFLEQGGEVNMTTYIRYYYGADILNDKTIPILEYIMSISKFDNSIIPIVNQIALLPKSLKMREFAKDVIVSRSIYEERIKQIYRYSFKRAPHKVIQLVFLKAIFEEAYKYKFIEFNNKKNYLNRIESLIERIFKDLGYNRKGDKNREYSMVSLSSGHKKEVLELLCNLRKVGFNKYFIKLIFDLRTCLFCSLFKDQRFNKVSSYLHYIFFIKEKSRFFHLNCLEKTLLVRGLIDIYSLNKKKRMCLHDNLSLLQENQKKWIIGREKIRLLINCKDAFKNIIISPVISRDIKSFLNKILKQANESKYFCYKMNHGREVLSYNARIN